MMKKFETEKEFEVALDAFNTNVIEKVFVGTGESGYAILDGPLNPKEYFHSKIKIVWVLKEGYDDGGESENKAVKYSDLVKKYWSYVDFLRGAYKTTWHPIVYTSYGILNKMKRNEMPSIRDDELLGLCLHNISIINISKYNAVLRQRTNMSNLNNLFKEKGQFVFKPQIELLEPNVVIFGGTFETVNEYLNILVDKNQKDISMHQMTDIYKKDDILYFHAFHPAARRNKETYCNEIISGVRKYLYE